MSIPGDVSAKEKWNDYFEWLLAEAEKFYKTIFEQKEYGEAYVLEKLAREMMAKDPKLKAEFE